MENASKALLIAGAVLICILLIGLGVGIVSKSKSVSDQANKVGTSLNKTASGKADSINQQLSSL